jgi:chemotaxis regulatin CheY-phosphate phosphatase CheZ
VAVDGPSGERDAPDEQPVREVPQAHDAPHDPDQPEPLKAVGELAAENADLYRKTGELTHALKTQQGRFGTWAREVARDREQAAQDKAQMAERLDKVLAMNEALADRVVGPTSR